MVGYSKEMINVSKNKTIGMSLVYSFSIW